MNKPRLFRRSSRTAKKRDKNPSRAWRPEEPRPAFRFPPLLGTILRWALALVILAVFLGSVPAYQSARKTADSLAAEQAELERERAGLEEELELFTDPEWRRSYWRWRTMRHKPGERYIDFVEPGEAL